MRAPFSWRWIDGSSPSSGSTPFCAHRDGTDELPGPGPADHQPLRLSSSCANGPLNAVATGAVIIAPSSMRTIGGALTDIQAIRIPTDNRGVLVDRQIRPKEYHCPNNEGCCRNNTKLDHLLPQSLLSCSKHSSFSACCSIVTFVKHISEGLGTIIRWYWKASIICGAEAFFVGKYRGLAPPSRRLGSRIRDASQTRGGASWRRRSVWRSPVLRR